MRFGRSLFGVAATLLVCGCGTRPSLPARPTGETVRVRLGVHGEGAVRNIPLEDYVAATALSELEPAAGHTASVAAMFEVQAIIARTYAQAHRGRHAREGFDLCSTTHCQVHEPDRLATSRWRLVARDAAARTAGLILWFDGRPADAVYHADCGGRTSAAADVWGSAGFPYLRALRDDGKAQDAHAEWRYAAGAETLRRALDGDARTRVGGPLTSIAVLTRDQSGRVQRVLLGGRRAVTVSGVDLRDVLTAALGARSIRSTRFDVRLHDGQFEFSGSGSGHGVGLCQAGALARVAGGEKPPAVLQRYYPGTVLVDGARVRLSPPTAPE